MPTDNSPQGRAGLLPKQVCRRCNPVVAVRLSFFATQSRNLKQLKKSGSLTCTAHLRRRRFPEDSGTFAGCDFSYAFARGSGRFLLTLLINREGGQRRFASGAPVLRRDCDVFFSCWFAPATLFSPFGEVGVACPFGRGARQVNRFGC
jgi:hypothetical protein